MSDIWVAVLVRPGGEKRSTEVNSGSGAGERFKWPKHRRLRRSQTNLEAGAWAAVDLHAEPDDGRAGIAALCFTPVVVTQAGLAAPLAYPIACIIVF